MATLGFLFILRAKSLQFICHLSYSQEELLLFPGVLLQFFIHNEIFVLEGVNFST